MVAVRGSAVRPPARPWRPRAGCRPRSSACEAGDGSGGAYLREQGIYSSQITEWRKLRDAGVLAGKKPGEKIGWPSAEQVEIARLTRELELTRRRLTKTEAALDIMGKAHALLEEISESADTEKKPYRR